MATAPRAVPGAEAPWSSSQHGPRAVLVADLVESVRMMNTDERGTIARWLQYVERVTRDLLVPLGGRLVKSYGDGFLLEFPDIRVCAQAAGRLHGMAVEESAAHPYSAQFSMRVGAHFCRLIVSELDLLGSGVNLAARLAGLAGPGETVVSDEFRDGLVDQLDSHLVDLGERFLKHFDQPVRAWQVGLRPGSGDVAATPRPNAVRSTLAVVPLRQTGGDTSAAALGDALADDIISALSRRRDLRLISRLSSAALRDIQVPLARIRALLGASYMLSGTFHTGAGGVTVRIRLTDLGDESVLWADTFNARVDDIFHGQETLIAKVAVEVSRHILSSEVKRARGLPVSSLEAYTLLIGGTTLMHRHTRADFERSRLLLEHLAIREPMAAAAHAQLAKWTVLTLAQGWAADPAAAGAQARSHALRALDLEPDHALALAMLGAALAHTGHDLLAARKHAMAATEADPNEPHAWLTLGAVHGWLGEPLLARELPDRALALSPLDPARFLFELFRASGLVVAQRFDEAVPVAGDAVRLNALHAPSHRVLTIALALAGKIAEARAAAARLLAVQPGFRVSEHARRYAGRGQPHAEQRLQALRAAGLPE